MLTAANHFGHRENSGIVVDLFWSRGDLFEFRVGVKDQRDGNRFILYPSSGREAIQDFYHPFSAATASRSIR